MARGLARRINALGDWPARGLALVCGMALALAQPPLSWFVCVFLALPPLVWLAAGARGWRGGFAIGWAAGVGFFAAGMFWIVEPFLVDPETFGWMAPFALIGMAGGLALFWGAAFGVARALGRGGPRGVILLACLWTLAEVGRSYLLTGFPWALAGYAWIETPVMQAASVMGPHGVSFLTLLAGLAAGLGWRQAGLALALVAVGWGWGALRLSLPVEARAEPVIVRLVQPNAPQQLKWRPDMQMEFYQRHLRETRAQAVPMPDVTIWSETAVPFVLGYADDLQAEVAASAPDGLVILGIQRLEATPETEQWFNALAVLRPDGRPWAVYDKHHLVPFGEYVPFAGAIARLGNAGLTTLTSRGFTPGSGPRLVSVPDLPPFLALICYEAIFPHQMRAPGGRAEWIVQVTNDAWFGELSGPYQHFAQTRARAIEQGLPVARSANTGISAMIDPMGRVLAALPLGVEGHVDAALPAALPATLYARTGDWPVVGAIVAIFLLTVSNFRSGVLFRASK